MRRCTSADLRVRLDQVTAIGKDVAASSAPTRVAVVGVLVASHQRAVVKVAPVHDQVVSAFDRIVALSCANHPTLLVSPVSGC